MKKSRFTESQIVTILKQADAGIPVKDICRREYNEERPKKALGGLTPSAYARKLASTTINPGL